MMLLSYPVMYLFIMNGSFSYSRIALIHWSCKCRHSRATLTHSSDPPADPCDIGLGTALRT